MMKEFVKKALSLILCLIMLFGTVAVGGEGIGETLASFSILAEALESTGNATFDAFINDSRFTNGISWGTIRPKLSTYDCWECCAYCADFVKYCFGYNTPKAGEYFTGATNIRAGDVIVVGGENGNGHWFVCLKRSGNSLYVAEGNYVSKVRIGWNYSVVNDSTISGSSYSFSHGWHYQAAHTCDYMASAKVTKAPTKTAAGSRVRTCSCGKTMTETIPAIPYTTGLEEGIYKVESKLKSNLLMTCFGNYNVGVWNSPGGDGYWLFRKNSDGTYTLENAYRNGKVLDVEGISMVKCANICGCSYNGGDNQKFYVIPEGSYYRLVAKNSYQTVDDYNAGTSDGNNIVQHTDNGTDAQRWLLKLSNPPLNLSTSSVTVSSGSSVTVNCTVGRETGGVIMNCNIADTSVCSASWGDWNGMTCPLTITGKSGGTTTLTITSKDEDTKIVYDTKTITVTVPDTSKPSASISATNNVASSQTATLSLSDNLNLGGYYWGTSSNYSDNTYTAVSGTSKSVTKTVSSAGTYYLTAKDAAGNISSTVSKTFYKTTLNANSGSVSPSSVITMSGNSFALPSPTRTGYSFKNWNTNSSGTGTGNSAGASYKPTGNVTLYAQWTESTKPAGSISSTNNVASSQTVTLSLSDNLNLAGYYWGTSSNYSDNTYTAVSGTSKSVTKTVSSAGTYYLTVKDAAGNISSTISKTFYKTTLNANDGSVSPESVITMSGNSFTLPQPTRPGYWFLGWADINDIVYCAGDSYTVEENNTFDAYWVIDVSYSANNSRRVVTVIEFFRIIFRKFSELILKQRLY
ncbi:MAG: InlB B-repeat-containing protein [Clostridiales bacterium]|nr:InlB B-repeat-containing protein [Clostridiales bacterium]